MADREYKPTYGQPGAPLLVALEFEIAQRLLLMDSFLNANKAVETTEGTMFVPRAPEEIAQRAADIAESLCKTAFEREWVQIARMNPPEAAGSEAPFIVGGGRRQ